MSPRETVGRWNAAEKAEGVAREHWSFFLPADSSHDSVLLLHGASGSPADFRHLGEWLARRGRNVLCPLLPRHGREPEALGELRFGDLVGKSLEAFDIVAGANGRVAVVAQSLGAVLAVHVAVRRPVTRIAALAPALRPFVLRRMWLLGVLVVLRPRLARATFRWQLEALRGIRETRGLVPEVMCPLLVLASRDDDSVSPRGATELHALAGSPAKRIELLDGHGHVLSRAPERERTIYGPVLELLDGSTARAS